MWYLRFSQHCCWRFKSSWGCVVQVVIISKVLWEVVAWWRSVTSHTMSIFYLSHVTVITVSSLGASANCEKGLSFVMSVCPCVHMELLSFHWMDFHEIFTWVFFKNLSRKFKFNENLTRVRGTTHEYMCTCVHLWQYLTELFWEWKMFQK